MADPTKDLLDSIEIRDDLGVKKALAEGANVNGKNDFGDTALHVCARIGDALLMPELVERGALINSRNALGQTPLHVAAANGNPQEVEMLIILDANLYFRDGLKGDGVLAADSASLNNEVDCYQMITQATELLELGNPLKAEKDRLAALAEAKKLQGFHLPLYVIPVAIIATGLIAVFGRTGDIE